MRYVQRVEGQYVVRSAAQSVALSRTAGRGASIERIYRSGEAAVPLARSVVSAWASPARLDRSAAELVAAARTAGRTVPTLPPFVESISRALAVAVGASAAALDPPVISVAASESISAEPSLAHRFTAIAASAHETVAAVRSLERETCAPVPFVADHMEVEIGVAGSVGMRLVFAPESVETAADADVTLSRSLSFEDVEPALATASAAASVTTSRTLASDIPRLEPVLLGASRVLDVSSAAARIALDPPLAEVVASAAVQLTRSGNHAIPALIPIDMAALIRSLTVSAETSHAVIDLEVVAVSAAQTIALGTAAAPVQAAPTIEVRSAMQTVSLARSDLRSTAAPEPVLVHAAATALLSTSLTRAVPALAPVAMGSRSRTLVAAADASASIITPAPVAVGALTDSVAVAADASRSVLAADTIALSAAQTVTLSRTRTHSIPVLIPIVRSTTRALGVAQTASRSVVLPAPVIISPSRVLGVSASAARTTPPVVFDSFTGQENALLSSHTPDSSLSGGSWHLQANQYRIESGQARAQASGVVAAIDTGISNNFRVACDMHVGGSPNSNQQNSLVFRLEDINNFWMARYNGLTNTVQVYYRHNGTFNLVDENPMPTLGAHHIEARVSGQNLNLFVDGMWVVQHYMIPFAMGATKAGFRAVNANARFDNFLYEPI